LRAIVGQGNKRVESNDHLRLAPVCRPLHHVS
jgi:hypothetical protein